MSNKLIYYLGNFDRPEANAAGKRVYGNALALASLGYTVILIGKTREDHAFKYPIHYAENVFYYSFPRASLINIGAFIAFIDELFETLGKPKLIVRYGTPALALFDRRLERLCRKNKITIVADAVDWLYSGSRNPIFNIIKSLDVYLGTCVYNRRSDGVIAISSFLSDYYKANGCKTVIIPPLVESYKQNLSINPIPTIVYAGSPFRLGRKVKKAKEVKDRLDLAVEGFAAICDSGKSLAFNIYGISKKDYLTAYPQHREILDKSSDHIKFYGQMPMAEVQKAVNSADFTILLRDVNRATTAGFPTKVVESLACGTPVITTCTSDLEKYINHGENGYYVDLSGNISEQLYEMLFVSQLKLQSMKQNCFNGKAFVYDKYVSALDGFIESLE